MPDLNLPSKEQVAIAVNAMRDAHFHCGYTRWPRDRYLEIMFWAAFFAAYLNSPQSHGAGQGS